MPSRTLLPASWTTVMVTRHPGTTTDSPVFRLSTNMMRTPFSNLTAPRRGVNSVNSLRPHQQMLFPRTSTTGHPSFRQPHFARASSLDRASLASFRKSVQPHADECRILHGPEIRVAVTSGPIRNIRCKFGVSTDQRSDSRTTYEAAFPVGILPDMTMSPGSSFTLGALVADVDEEGGEKHELALTPDGVSSGGVRMTLR